MSVDVVSFIVFNVVAIAIGVYIMSEALNNLSEKVAAIVTVVDSAISLINEIAGQVRECAATPEALNALAADLESRAEALGLAIAANTAADGEVEPEEPTEDEA